MIQLKSLNGLTTLLLGVGLIMSNAQTLSMLSKRDSGLHGIASQLPNTPYSSFSIRSSEKADGAKEWAIAQNQHSPKTLLEYRDIRKESPGFNGIRKSDSFIHKESVAYAHHPMEGGDGHLDELMARNQECLELGLTGKANGKMIGSGVGTAGSGFFYQIPIIGPVAASLFFSEAQRTSGNLGQDMAKDFNDC